jgi:hypothetical protein
MLAVVLASPAQLQATMRVTIITIILHLGLGHKHKAVLPPSLLWLKGDPNRFRHRTQSLLRISLLLSTNNIGKSSNGRNASSRTTNLSSRG